MVNKEELAQWLYKNRDHLALKVMEGRWTREWWPGLYDLRVSLSLGSQEFEGRGLDTHPDLALTKAAAEAIERAVCRENNIGTNGVALHTQESIAKINAKNELFERDQFLCHFLTQTPFCNFNKLNSISFPFESTKAKLANLGVEIALKTTHFSNPKTVICISRKLSGPGSFSLILGLGSGTSIEIAAQKAFLECLSNTVWRIHEKNKSFISLQEFNENSQHTSLDHQEVYLSDHNSLDVDWAFESHTEVQRQPDLSTEVSFEILKSSLEVLKTAPIFIYRAHSAQVQNIFYGPTRLNAINWDRINKFKGAELTKDQINWSPHPIG